MMLQKLIKKARHPYPQNKMEIRICITVISILACGIALSVITMDWRYFERSGSLVVIVGIYIAWRDITGNIDRYMGKMDDQTISQLDNINKDQDGFMSDLAKNNMKELLQKQSDEMQEYLELRKVRLRTIEAGALVVGTCIWGFGGAIGNLVYEFA